VSGEKTAIAYKRSIIREETASEVPSDELQDVVQCIKTFCFGNLQVFTEILYKRLNRSWGIGIFIEFGDSGSLRSVESVSDLFLNYIVTLE
jgi:hypothetical protein